MQKRRNDVKARTTLLLALPDEHQLRFSKYETAKELWEATLNTFSGNEATKKTKKNQLKQQYGNFKAKGSETLKQTFNRLQAIVCHLEFMDVEIEQDDLNQKFLTSLAPEWLIGKGEIHTDSVSTASIQVFTASTDVAVASLSHDTAILLESAEHLEVKIEEKRESYKQGPKEEELAPKELMDIDGIGWDWSYIGNEEENHALVADDEVPTEFALMAKSSSSSENKLELVKKEKEGLDNKLTSFESASKDLDNLIGSLRSDKNKEGLGYNAVPHPPAQVYSPPKKDLSWTSLPEFVDDTVTDYSRPTPSIDTSKCNLSDLQSSNFFVSEHGESSGSIMSKPMIKFVKAADCPRVIKTNNTKNARKSTVKYAEMYRNTSKSPKTIVATSTTKAEYVAAASGCGQVLWIQNQMLDYGYNFMNTKIYTDNNSAIKTEHNIDFHQIVDFLEASHIRYALTISPTIYVSHIRQFWSTARIETTNQETKILATVDGKPRTISDSSLRRHLKLSDEEGISSLPDTKLFENLLLMGYNILPNQRFTFQKGQFSHQWKFLIHTIMQCLSPKSNGFNEFSSNIATAVGEGSAIPTEPHHTPSPQEHHSLQRDSPPPSHPTTTSEPLQDRTGKTSTRPLDADEGSMQQKLQELMDLCTSLQRQQSQMAAKIKDQDLEISGLKARVKFLEDKDRGSVKPTQEDAPIKKGIKEIGEVVGADESTELGSNDTEEMVNVLSSMKAANILTSRVAAASVSPAAGVSAAGVPTVSGSFPIVSAIFTTDSVKVVESKVLKKRKLQEQIYAQVAKEMEEEFARENQRVSEQLARDSEIARLHAEEELKMMIEEKIELINELVKYQDHHAKILKYQAQQSKPLSKKEQREFYMSILRSHAGWKTRHFRGMTLEEIKEKFIPVWKQLEDFVPMSSKEEGERVKRQGLKIEQGSSIRMKTSEGVSEEDLKGMMQLVPLEEVYVEALHVKHLIIDWEIHYEGKREYWKIIRLGGHTAVYQFFVDMLKQFDREDLHQLWILVKEILCIKQATKDKEKELWVELKRLLEPDFEDQLWTHNQAFMHDSLDWKLYDTCGVHHVFTKDQEIFMLVEKDYPLRRGLATIMICNKLQVEQYSQMANDLILKIHNIANSPR
nr:ribonuclease H-like domain, reverse transcriptase, RNA-dependent DNA polymerase [Tanacetum cinerariifolium]